MEPLSAGASVIAFVQVASKLATAVNAKISHLKDSPHILSQLASDVEILRNVLQRLANPDLMLAAASPPDLTALTRLTSECSADLGKIEQKLAHLTITPSDRRTTRLRKKFRTAFSEDDLTRFCATVQGHVSRLDLMLTLLNAEKLAADTTVTESRSNNIIHLLKQLQTQVTDVIPQLNNDSSKQDTAQERNEWESPMLSDCVARLCELVCKKGCLMDSDQAQWIIHDIRALLESGRRRLIDNASHQDSTGDDADVEEIERSWPRDLELAQSLFFAAPSISINSEARRSVRPLIAAGEVISKESKRKIIELEAGMLTIRSNKRRRKLKPSQESSEHAETTCTSNPKDVLVDILFQPKDSRLTIATSIYQGQLVDGTFTSIPRLSINVTVPENSEIFSLLWEGRLDEVKKLLAEGKASLRDHDEMQGWSLLYYGIRDVDTCRFLIQHGADVNEVGFGRVGTWRLPLSAALDWGNEEVVRLLLDEGADPTLFTNSHTSVLPLLHAIESFTLDTVKLIMEKSGPALDLESKDDLGYTPLLLACAYWAKDSGYRATIRGAIYLLLDKGADIHARTNNGSTCLHVCFQNFKKTAKFWDTFKTRTVLVSLFQHGADIDARDNHGHTIEDRLYCVEDEVEEDGYYRWVGNMSYRIGFQRDLWDAVLAACGRPIPARRNDLLEWRHTNRRDFEEIWRDQEHLCPYWEDRFSLDKREQ